jgi:hypothetical protein
VVLLLGAPQIRAGGGKRRGGDLLDTLSIRPQLIRARGSNIIFHVCYITADWSTK